MTLVNSLSLNELVSPSPKIISLVGMSGGVKTFGHAVVPIALHGNKYLEVIEPNYPGAKFLYEISELRYTKFIGGKEVTVSSLSLKPANELTEKVSSLVFFDGDFSGPRHILLFGMVEIRRQ